MRTTVVGVALLAMGCGGAQHFDAVERATATSPRGDVAAEYEIGDPNSPTAEVKVWTRGAYESVVDGREVTVIAVVVEVENMGSAPIELEGVTLHGTRAAGASFADLAPFRVEGERVVGPGSESSLRAFFALAERYDPEDIAQFEVSWALRHGGGTYVQRTPFQQAPDEYATYYGYPYPYLFYIPFAGPSLLPGTLPP